MDPSIPTMPAPPARAGDPPSIGALLVSARSYGEYLAMFDLTPDQLAGRRVLDCPGGAASFTVGAAEAGAAAIAVDPVYAHPHDVLAAHARSEVVRGNDHIRDHPERFVWSYFSSVDDHLRSRLAAVERFEQDRRRVPERYLAGSLPNLPFPDDAFDLAVSSHLLFTYDDRLDEQLHVDAARELLRVAAEVRVFPTLSLRDAVSDHVAAVTAALEADGAAVELRTSPYQLQRGEHDVLVARR
jgi:hypothetical protein